MSVNKVEALKKVYYNLSQQNSKGNTVAEVLQDIYAALSDETTKQSNVTHLIDMISEYAEGGGGGSGDFTTANVTVTADFGAKYYLPIMGDAGITVAYEATAPGGEQCVVPLYNGKAFCSLDYESGTQVTCTGNINYDEEEDVYVITGDGTMYFRYEIS